MQAFLVRATEVDWVYAPAQMNRWKPGFPEFLIFATLTCSPWRWVLVAPSRFALPALSMSRPENSGPSSGRGEVA